MEKAKRKAEVDEFNDEHEGVVPKANGQADNDSGSEQEPNRKIPKLASDGVTKPLADLSLNPMYLKPEFMAKLAERWQAKSKEDYKDDNTQAVVYGEPFQMCLLPDLLQHRESCQALVNEMIENVHWYRKQMDLYEFYQSTDLSNLNVCRLLTNFLQVLRRDVRPWLEKITNLKLDYVSASCSMYTCGDYLLVHDDLLKDRQIAYVYYLSPWQGAEQWTNGQGGCLEVFNSDENCFPQFPVCRKIAPKNNQLAFFKVGSRSFHQVGEVTSFDLPRLTINGWFHGATNDDFMPDNLRPFASQEFQQPQVNEEISLDRWLNELYLTTGTRRNIQKRIEENSEICLYDFFRREVFDDALKQLLTDDSLKWRRHGPANAQNYEVLDVSSAKGTVGQLVALFTSEEICWLLRDYTELDLAGSDAVTPTLHLEIQRWSHGDYTVLGEGAICEDNILDLIYYLNASEGAGIITYLTSEDAPDPGNSGDYEDAEEDSVLLTVTPVDNALNIVYRCRGTTKFTKYISHNTPLEKGPAFIIAASYKE